MNKQNKQQICENCNKPIEGEVYNIWNDALGEGVVLCEKCFIKEQKENLLI